MVSYKVYDVRKRCFVLVHSGVDAVNVPLGLVNGRFYGGNVNSFEFVDGDK